MEEARGPMRSRRDLHFKALSKLPVIAESWKSVKGAFPGESDVEAMFADFVPPQLECLRDHAALRPDVADVVQGLQARGIKIGSTAGFTRSMVDMLVEEAARQGYPPGCFGRGRRGTSRHSTGRTATSICSDWFHPQRCEGR